MRRGLAWGHQAVFERRGGANPHGLAGGRSLVGRGLRRGAVLGTRSVTICGLAGGGEWVGEAGEAVQEVDGVGAWARRPIVPG